MGLEHKKEVGTYMGEQASNQKEKPAAGNGVGGASFKRGKILEGVPDMADNYPKAGKDIAPSFQDMRNQDPKQGTI